MYNKFHKEPLDNEIAELIDISRLFNIGKGIFNNSKF